MNPCQPQGRREEVLSSRTLCPVRFEKAGVPKEPTEKDQLIFGAHRKFRCFGRQGRRDNSGKATESPGKGGGWLWRGSLNALMPGTWHLATIYLEWNKLDLFYPYKSIKVSVRIQTKCL